MPRKMYSRNMELIALRSICEYAEERAGQFLFARLSADHFATEIGRVAWKRINHYMQKTGYIPEWMELVTDPALNQSIRDDLEDFDHEGISNKAKIQKVLRRLSEFKKERQLLEVARNLEKYFKSEESESEPVDDVIKKVQDSLANANDDGGFSVVHIGQNSNVEKMVDKILAGTALSFVPTGFSCFDDKNRGFIPGSAILIAGETGAGKSLLLGQLANNMALTGAHVAVVPLEMINIEVVQRDIARNTDASLSDLLDPVHRLSEKDRDNVYESMMRHSDTIERRGGRLSYYEFESEVTIQSALATLKPYDYDVIMIDYVGLLAGLDGDDQWRAMNNALRYAKRWAAANKKIVILAAQLKEDGDLRQSKAMKDHCNNMWTWKADEVFKATGVAVIKQPKSRQQSGHDLYIKFDHSKMIARDATKEDIAAMETVAVKSRGKGGTSKQRWKEAKDEDWDADNENEEYKPKKSNSSRRTRL